MELFFGLVFVALAIFWGQMTLGDVLGEIAKQMKQRNKLREAELRAKGVPFDSSDADEAKA